uniref:Putative secreted protein n=1 Tax=Anopheles triannulatus TaxID=58253 RepID=A0A2M4B0H5_9DIPT
MLDGWQLIILYSFAACSKSTLCVETSSYAFETSSVIISNILYETLEHTHAKKTRQKLVERSTLSSTAKPIRREVAAASDRWSVAILDGGSSSWHNQEWRFGRDGY